MPDTQRVGGDVPSRTRPRVAVIGAGLAGLLAAAAAASAGSRVILIERDRLPAAPESRKGVPQDRQPHILLHRGIVAACELLPGLDRDLMALGAARFNSGSMPQLSAQGWFPTTVPAYDVICLTRPALEHAVRVRVRQLPGVDIHEGVRVAELHRVGGAWRISAEDETTFEADIVVDASGRGSRMPHWLRDLGAQVGEPEQVDAQLGYATRVYRAAGEPPLSTGVLLRAALGNGRGGLALPVEDGQWLITAAGYGEQRPVRGTADFEPYLTTLRDPALAELSRRLEPAGDVAIFRQTGNRRHQYGRYEDWPDGLLVLGDAFCVFNPVYGQGITVAALQALHLRDALGSGRPLRTRSLQRRIAAVSDMPWAISTNSDHRFASNVVRLTTTQRLLNRWIDSVGQLAAHGNARATQVFASVYHLVAEPSQFFGPALLAAVARARLRGVGAPTRRPAALDALARQPSRPA